MADITAAMVKELREASGAGMMDCKAALNETGGDMDAAADWLRTKGLAKAAKKAGRVAAEGLVAVATSGACGSLVEVNSETDFVARNETFQSMVKDIADISLASKGDLAALLAADYPGAGKSVEAHVQEMVGTIGENMTVRRSASVDVSQGIVSQYIHGQVAAGMGKIGVLVGLESAGDASELDALGRQIAMHVAATRPLAVSLDELDAAEIERERNLLIAEAKESGKPDNIIDKMVEGRLRKFYEEVVLDSQIFVIDGESRVGDVVKKLADKLGTPVTLKGFVRMELGEGVEKGPEEDFAAEVAAVAGKA